MATRGITSGIRGLKYHTQRPDLVLLDDLQTSEDASSPEQVEKFLNIIKKDVFNLAGKGKLAILQTATPIAPEDLAERIANDPAWKTTIWPSIIFGAVKVNAALLITTLIFPPLVRYV